MSIEPVVTSPTIEDLEKKLDGLLQSFETVMLSVFHDIEARVSNDDRGTVVTMRTVNGKRGVYARRTLPMSAKGPHFEFVRLNELSLRGKIRVSEHLRALILEAGEAESRLYGELEGAIEYVEAALAMLRG